LIGRYALVSGLFLRLLGLIYLAAFVSTAFQIIGLAGEQGILPVAEKIAQLRAERGEAGFWSFPTLFWLNDSDDALFAAALAGCGFSVALFLNVLPRLSLIILFILYLSLFHAGQLFMNFQWDYLLLESGFAAIFLAGGSRPAVWLFRWILFRVRFMSGVAKLVSQDPTWASFTALNYFFETQPLPHWGGWYAHQLPDWLLRFATGSALFIEIVVPFLMFMPRKLRFAGAWATILMQVVIILTSNHNYANFLVLALCLFLFDDQAVTRIMPKGLARWLSSDGATSPWPKGLAGIMTASLAAVLFALSLVQMTEMFSPWRSPEPVATAVRAVRPFRVVNNYHVFPTMNTQRIELLIEGSVDGYKWRTYEFKYKPGDVMRRPGVVVPHHPRLDWLMWFVPSHPVFLPWFEQFLQRLSDNSPAVLDLMKNNPFPDQVVPYLRVSAYRYQFASAEKRAETGQWWEREYLGPFYPLPVFER